MRKNSWIHLLLAVCDLGHITKHLGFLTCKPGRCNGTRGMKYDEDQTMAKITCSTQCLAHRRGGVNSYCLLFNMSHTELCALFV